MNKLFILCLSFCLLLGACETDEKAVEQPINYEQFSKSLSAILNQIADDLRTNGSDFSDLKQVQTSSQAVLNSNFSEDKSALQAFSDSFDKASWISGANENARYEQEVIEIPEFQYRVIEKVDSLWAYSTSPDDYKSGLSALFDNIQLNETDSEEKDQVLVYIISQIVAIDFIQNNPDLLNAEGATNGRTMGWWDDWGKCASGIIGGATGGAITGGELGLKVGTLLASPVKGAVIGGILGGIGGGFGGASLACGSGGSNSSDCSRPNCPRTKCNCP